MAGLGPQQIGGQTVAGLALAVLIISGVGMVGGDAMLRAYGRWQFPLPSETERESLLQSALMRGTVVTTDATVLSDESSPVPVILDSDCTRTDTAMRPPGSSGRHYTRMVATRFTCTYRLRQFDGSIVEARLFAAPAGQVKSPGVRPLLDESWKLQMTRFFSADEAPRIEAVKAAIAAREQFERRERAMPPRVVVAPW
jgi:hypothetical protein